MKSLFRTFKGKKQKSFGNSTPFLPFQIKQTEKNAKIVLMTQGRHYLQYSILLLYNGVRTLKDRGIRHDTLYFILFFIKV